MTPYSNCDGSFYTEELAIHLDKMADDYRSFPGYYNPSYEERVEQVRRQRAADSRTRREDEMVRALLRLATPGYEQRDAAEAERIAREHGFDPVRLTPMKTLAHSRGVELEVVLRAALRGDLRDIVALPPRTPERAVT